MNRKASLPSPSDEAGAPAAPAGRAAAILGDLVRCPSVTPKDGGALLLVEGPAVNGTAKAMTWLSEQGIRFDGALVGEPTSVKRVGDAIKVGRRGSLSGTLRVEGRQGHVAYPDRADNPIPRLVRLLAALS